MKLKSKLMTLFVTTLSLVTSVHAAVPVAASDAFTGVQTDGLALIDLAWPVAAAITGGVILIGLFKKVVRKAAS